MARVTHVLKARKDIPSAGIKAGESYYWWKFRFGGKHYSKTPPKRSQLTQSAFYGSIFDLQDMIGEAQADESLRDLRDDIVSTLEDIKSECESSFDNIPEALQSGNSGELLQERISAMENAIDEFSNLDLDAEPDFDEPDREEDETEEDYAARIDDLREQAEDEHWCSLRDELIAIDIDAP